MFQIATAALPDQSAHRSLLASLSKIANLSRKGVGSMPSSYNIGSHYEALVRTLVESGRYASASEVMRDGLRLLEEREEQRQTKLAALRRAIQEGVDSGPGIPAEEVFAQLKARYRRNGRD
jgi:antitoxin ParD1/3/4